MHYKETEYGFEYGDAKIQRFFSDDKKGWVTIGLNTSKVEMQIYITRTGKVRIHSKEGEWFPKDKAMRNILEGKKRSE